MVKSVDILKVLQQTAIIRVYIMIKYQIQPIQKVISVIQAFFGNVNYWYKPEAVMQTF